MLINMETILCKFTKENWRILGLVVGLTAGYYYRRKYKRIEKEYFDILEGIPHESIFTSPSDTFRLVLVVRSDIHIEKAELAVQCARATIISYRMAAQLSPNALKRWLYFSEAEIIILKIDDKCDMEYLEHQANFLNFPLAGGGRVLSHTMRLPGYSINKNEKTSIIVAIGPAPKEVVDIMTGHLKLY